MKFLMNEIEGLLLYVQNVLYKGDIFSKNIYLVITGYVDPIKEIPL